MLPDKRHNGSRLGRLHICCFFRAMTPAVLACGIVTARANPVVVSPWGTFQRQPYSEMVSELAAMTEEDVRIKVGDGFSTVSGNHRFLLPPLSVFSTIGEPDIFHVYVPVLLPTDGVDLYEKTHGLPSVGIEGIKLHAVRMPPPAAATLGMQLSRVRLPRGWHIQWYKAAVPIIMAAGDFRITTRYVQPHFWGNISAYLPLRPPADSVESQVVFHASDGGSLRGPGLLSFLSPPREAVAFTPLHRRLLQTTWRPATGRRPEKSKT